MRAGVAGGGEGQAVPTIAEPTAATHTAIPLTQTPTASPAPIVAAPATPPASVQMPTVTRTPKAIPPPATATPMQVAVTPDVPDERSSSNERATPTVTDAELADLVRGNSTFASDLYRSLSAEDGGNLFFSPLSISMALAMTYAGARGETERQMADVLHFLLPQASLHAAFNALDRNFALRRGRAESGFRLHIANAVWGQEDYEFLPNFLDELAENYGSGVRPVDFRESPGKSRLTINNWVADKTGDRVRDLIPERMIDRLTRMVVTNAIYFKAAWYMPFEESSTVARPFYLLSGGQVNVLTMGQTDWFRYARGDGYQAIELPYEDGISMAILLPDEGRFREFEDSLDSTLVTQIVGDIKSEFVSLTMPKFDIESQFKLADALKEVGMPHAFDGGLSDFSGMDGRSCLAGDMPCLFIRDVVHKTFVSVDEEGTEAVAASAVVMIMPVSDRPRPEPITVSVDRPFVFLIRDSVTDAILFVGRVLEP